MNERTPLQTARSSIVEGSQPDDYKGVIRINAAAIADAQTGVISPGALLVDREGGGSCVLGSGTPRAVDAMELPEPVRTLNLPGHVVIPGLVNAHTHLDLTHIGVQPHEPGDGFVSWVDMIRANRRHDDQGIMDAVRLGVHKLLAGGTVAVGDIAGAPNGRMTAAPAFALGESPLVGVSYFEFFGIGKTAQRTRERVEGFIRDEYPEIAESLVGSCVRLGLQPHAPNTVDRSIYEWIAGLAGRLGIPLSTHLAESPEERAFVMHAEGPQRALLERLRVWDDTTLKSIGEGKHPVAHLGDVLKAAPFLAAHVNDASDEAIGILAQTRTAVAYCPRASEYFGAAQNFGHHRYQEMLDAGVAVCLGTDSIVNLDTPDRISVLDEMRLLHRRDAADAQRLLAMATTNAARALGLEERGFTLCAGSTPRGLVAIEVEPGSSDPWGDAMASDAPPEWVFPPAFPNS